MKNLKYLILLTFVCVSASAIELKPNDPAPPFIVKTQQGKSFDLASRKGKWTVLYFYPKAGTPGCTKQACAFRDSIAKIRALGAEVYGISSDTVEDQAAFHKQHHLNFDLLADPDATVVKLYAADRLVLKFAKRWTYIIDPDLKIRNIMKEVDPVLDADRVANEISKLQKN